MNEKNMHPEDQFNLSNLKNIVRSALRSFFRFCSFVEVTIENGRFIMLGLGLAGCILGGVYYFSSTKSYKASMVVTYNKLTKRTFGEVIAQLDLLTSTGTASKLAKELKIPTDIAVNINFIESTTISNLTLMEDTSTKVNQPFKINVGLSKSDSIESIQNALLAYLNNIPYLKHLNDEERKIFTERLSFIERELEKLDTLESEYNQFLSSTKVSSTFYNNAINPAEIYVQSNTLIQQRESLLRSLNIDNNTVSLIDGFKPTVLSRPISLMRTLLLTGSLGIIAGFIISFLMETRKKVMQLKI